MTTLQRLLDRAVEHDHLVGAQLAVLCGGSIHSAVAGVQDLITRQVVSERTQFEIGSVTKPLVAAALLLAQDEGMVDLDAPVTDQVPEFRPHDPAAGAITTRHLLSHTSGLAGDFFPDTGRDPDAIAAFVELLAAQPLDVAPGRTVSYSNGAYVLAGRVLERITGATFDAALSSLLLHPAGADRMRTWNDSEDAERMSGHELEQGSAPAPVSRRFPRALTPAGGVVASAADLGSLVRALTIAPTDDLPLWLPERSREPLAPLVDRPGTSIGWGWGVTTSRGEALLTHDGGTFGASSFVRVLPERDVVAVLLTGRSGVGRPGQALVESALQELGAPPLTAPAPEHLPEAVRAQQAVIGSYRRTGGVVDVRERDGGLWCVVSTADGESGGTRYEGPLALQPSGAWSARTQAGELSLVFLGDAGAADCVVVGARAHTRQPAASTRPGRAPVRAPSRTTGRPATSTCGTPSGGSIGDS